MNRVKITAIVAAAAALVLIAVALYRYYTRPVVPHIDISREKYPVTGIDVSAHNGVIDFDSIASNGIDFVLIKASEGSSFRDSLFESNYAKAALAGLKTGVYHFFRFDCDGWSQAENVLKAVAGKRIDLPIVIDIEEWGNMEKFSTKQITDQLQSMIDHLEENGWKVMIYTNKNGFNRFIRSQFDRYPLWICSFTDPPIDANWDYWQYSHIGEIPGAPGKADLNTFNGNRQEWQQWINKYSPTIQ